MIENQKFGREPMRGFCVWRMCLQALRPAIAFSECVVDWSPTVQASALSDSKYHHFHVVISAKDSGDVLIRPHVYKFPLLMNKDLNCLLQIRRKTANY